jgi:hypothetical protein
MVVIPDINKTEKWFIEITLNERYGENRSYLLAAVDIRLQDSVESIQSH